MKNIKIELLLGIFLALLISACGSGGNPEEETTPEAITPVTITGITIEPIPEIIELRATSQFQKKVAIKSNTKGEKEVVAIGSGGNINKIFSMSKRKDQKPLPLELLRDYYKELSSVSITERIKVYNLREDRADVIVPALLVYINAMRWSGATEILVPRIGLVDGLIHHLLEKLK